MPRKYGSDAVLDCDCRALQARRTAAARQDTKPEVTPLESSRSKSEFRELQDRWSFLERLYELPF
jgi:hypothetical protein